MSSLLFAKVTDDILMAGSSNDMECFVNRVKKTSVTNQATIDLPIELNGTVKTRDNLGSITISMETYSQNIELIEVSKHRRMERAKPVWTRK